MNSHLKFFEDSKFQTSSQIFLILFLCFSASSSLCSSTFISGFGPPSILVVTTIIEGLNILTSTIPSIADADIAMELIFELFLSIFSTSEFSLVASISNLV